MMRIKRFKLRFTVQLICSVASAIGLVLFFQNCAPKPQTCTGAKCSSTGSSSNNAVNSNSTSVTGGINGSTGNSTTYSGSGSGTGTGSGSGGSTNTTTYSGGGSTGVSTGSGGSTGSGTVSTTDGSSTGTVVKGSTAFGFYKNLNDLSIVMERKSGIDSGYGSISVQPVNYTGAVTYKWFKDGKELIYDQLRTVVMDSEVLLIANDYLVDGSYYVQFKNATGAVITSRTAKVSVNEPAGPCAPGTYFSSSYDPINQNPQLNYQSRFVNIRGKWLIDSGSIDTATLNYSPGPRGYRMVANLPSAAWQARTSLTCEKFLTNIHESSLTFDYPNCVREQFSSVCSSTLGRWTGTLNFECRNNRWLFTDSSCLYTPPPPPPPNGGR